jgi:hypothetical protein
MADESAGSGRAGFIKDEAKKWVARTTFAGLNVSLMAGMDPPTNMVPDSASGA